MYFVLVVLVVIVFLCLVYQVSRYEENTREIFSSKKLIDLDTLVLYSNKQLVRNIKKYFTSQEPEILVEYAEYEYLTLYADETEEEMINKLNQLQDRLIRQRYIPGSKLNVDDSVTRVMFDIWLDYAYAYNYRVIFNHALERMLKEQTISNSTFNEAYRRFHWKGNN